MEKEDSRQMLNTRRVGADYSAAIPVDLDVLKDNVINLLYNQREKGAANAT